MQSSLAARLKGLRDIASLVNAGSDLPTILEHIVSAVCRHTAWSSSGVMKVNLESGFSELMVRHDPGHAAPHNLPTRWRLTTSPALRVAGTGMPIIIPDAQNSDEFPDYRADATARGYHTVVVLPVAATDALGNRMVLSVQSPQVVPVADMELAFLTTIAHLGAIAVEKVKRLEAERAQSERLRRVLAVNESLLARALAGESMLTLLGTVEALLPEPLVVVDLTTHTVLARRSPAPDVVSEPDWRRFVRRKAAGMLMELARSTSPSGFNARVTIDFAGLGLDLQLAAIVEPMEIDGEQVGALLLFPRTAEGNPLDLLLAQEAKLAINVHLLRGYVRAQSRTELAGELIGALVSGAPLGTDAVWSRAEQLGVELAQPACLLAVGLPDAASAAPPPLRHALTLLTARAWPGALVASQGAELAVLLPGAADQLARVRLLAKRIARGLSWHGDAPAVAIGGPCHALADYPQAWRECLRLLGLGRTFKRSGVLEPASFGPFAELLSALNGNAVQDFIARTLGAAAGYDARHNAHLVDTVASFIEGGCRYQPCAEKLGIHVSTLRYRIDRFQDLTGADLADPETRFSFALAVRLRGVDRARPAGSDNS